MAARSKMCRPGRAVIYRISPFLFTALLSNCGGGVEPAKFTAAPADSVLENRRDNAQEKVDGIVANGAKSPVPPLTTVFTEDEVNQLLRVHLKDYIPNGLSDPHVRLIGNDALVARVVVDLDEYKRRRQGRGGLGPLALLSGRLPVTARGILQVQDGHGQFRLQGADVNGIPFPPALVREMITALSRNRRNPEGYDIEKPFALPANIKKVIINPRELVAIQ